VGKRKEKKKKKEGLRIWIQEGRSQVLDFGETM